jgi:predicted GNAT superfamily acetyltransferase
MADDIVVRPARARSDYDACVLLQRAVWGLEDIEITSAIQLIATTHAGGMLHIAEATGGRTVGFAYAFPALRGGTPHLHSDMLAVLPEYQQRGVGLRLKWAQREESLSRGLGLITWTFDPMQTRNANLNLRRLGAPSSSRTSTG